MYKPRFSTQALADKAIRDNVRFVGCTSIFISELYAKAHGVELAGWYLWSRNDLPWCVR